MMTAEMTAAMAVAAVPMAAAGFTTTGGYQLAPATPAAYLDGFPVTRVGLWGPGEPAPFVLTEPEITVALAHGSETAESWGLLVDTAARGTLSGLAKLGRGQLAELARRWHDDGDPSVFPPGTVVKRYAKAAAQVCKAAHRDRK